MPNTDIDLRTIAKEQVAIRRNLEDINLSLKQIAQHLRPMTEEEMMAKATEKFINEYIPKKFVDESKEDQNGEY